jgi:hypothetical protein
MTDETPTPGVGPAARMVTQPSPIDLTESTDNEDSPKRSGKKAKSSMEIFQAGFKMWEYDDSKNVGERITFLHDDPILETLPENYTISEDGLITFNTRDNNYITPDRDDLEPHPTLLDLLQPEHIQVNGNVYEFHTRKVKRIKLAEDVEPKDDDSHFTNNLNGTYTFETWKGVKATVTNTDVADYEEFTHAIAIHGAKVATIAGAFKTGNTEEGEPHNKNFNEVTMTEFLLASEKILTKVAATEHEDTHIMNRNVGWVPDGSPPMTFLFAIALWLRINFLILNLSYPIEVVYWTDSQKRPWQFFDTFRRQHLIASLIGATLGPATARNSNIRDAKENNPEWLWKRVMEPALNFVVKHFRPMEVKSKSDGPRPTKFKKTALMEKTNHEAWKREGIRRAVKLLYNLEKVEQVRGANENGARETLVKFMDGLNWEFAVSCACVDSDCFFDIPWDSPRQLLLDEDHTRKLFMKRIKEMKLWWDNEVDNTAGI